MQSIFEGFVLGASGGLVLAVAVLVPGGEVAALIAASFWWLLSPAVASTGPVAEAVARSKIVIGDLDAASAAFAPALERGHA